MSFSAHADAKGIIQLIKHLQPKNVMFVHGEGSKMKILAKLIED
jgi:integrator complex subunit 11